MIPANPWHTKTQTERNKTSYPYPIAPYKGGTPLQPWMTLALTHRHERDNDVHFDEPTHIYTIKGSSKGVISCTKVVHACFPEFNPDEVIEKMMKSPNWPNSQYFGMTAAAIKAKWNASGRQASSSGTDMHLAIEMFLNGGEEAIAPAIKLTPEWKYFQKYWAVDSQKFEPWRTEWEIFDEDLKLAGQIDIVYRNKLDGTFAIYDWKRAKDMKMENDFEMGLGPLSRLPNCNYSHYSLQLNLYRWFLQTHYNMSITELALVVLHPNQDDFRVYPVPMLDDIVEEVIESRRRAVREGRGRYLVFEGQEMSPALSAPALSATGAKGAKAKVKSKAPVKALPHEVCRIIESDED